MNGARKEREREKKKKKKTKKREREREIDRERERERQTDTAQRSKEEPHALTDPPHTHRYTKQPPLCTTETWKTHAHTDLQAYKYKDQIRVVQIECFTSLVMNIH